MTAHRGADVFARCLEAEGVRHVFGIPGEETLDLDDALHRSSIDFVAVRHEQGGAYMANMMGRLTGRAGVCLGTLGPGALNLVTAVADADLDRAPLVALTGRRALEWMHKESHQVVDLVEVMHPIAKCSARVPDPDVIPEIVRKAFMVAQADKPGATQLELPEDIMAAPLQASRLPRRAPRRGDVHGHGRDRLRGPARARHGRRPRSRLRALQLRRRRRRHRGRTPTSSRSRTLSGCRGGAANPPTTSDAGCDMRSRSAYPR